MRYSLLALCFLPLVFAGAADAAPEHLFRLSGGGLTGNANVTYNNSKDEIDLDESTAYALEYWNLYATSPAADLYFGVQWSREDDIDYLDGAASFNATIDSAMLNAMYKGDAFFLGAGFGVSTIDVTGLTGVTLGATYLVASGDHDETEFAWQVIGGVDKAITDGMSIGVLYRYLNTAPTFDNLSLGSMKSRFGIHSLSASLTFGF